MRTCPVTNCSRPLEKDQLLCRDCNWILFDYIYELGEPDGLHEDDADLNPPSGT